MLEVAPDIQNTSSGSILDEIARDGARQMLAAACRAEVDAYIDADVGSVIVGVLADRGGKSPSVIRGPDPYSRLTTPTGASRSPHTQVR